jgi:hypothetical protein
MAAYLKTDMPFYGVQSAGLNEIVRAVQARFELRTQREYESVVRAIWRLPHREEKYLAIRVARMVKDRVGPSSLPLPERVACFVEKQQDRLSGLSVREALKALRRTGQIP